MLLKDEVQSIISGTGIVTKGTAIKTASDHLRKGKATGAISQEKEHIKEQEAAVILSYAIENNFFLTGLNKDRYLAEGAEQKVYLNDDGLHVTKINDTIFYASWRDYFNSLLLHNYFFPATAYELVGFYSEDNKLYAAVEQRYIVSTEKTNEQVVKEFMLANGFLNTKNADFLNPQLGIIAEDLHDENVLTQNGVLFFIDTVFYLTKDFFKK